MGEKHKRRVGNLTAIFMLIAAFTVDALQILLVFLNIIIVGLGVVLSIVLSVVAACGFALWFFSKNVSFIAGKKAVAKFLTTLSSVTIELTGLISALPMMTINVATIIVLSRAEDAETAREQRAAEAAALRAANDNEQQLAAAEVAQQEAYAAEGERVRGQAA